MDNTHIFIEKRVTVYEDENRFWPPGYSKKYTDLLTLNTNFEIFLQRNVNIVSSILQESIWYLWTTSFN
jgi:hypothetical protein